MRYKNLRDKMYEHMRRVRKTIPIVATSFKGEHVYELITSQKFPELHAHGVRAAGYDLFNPD